MLRRYFPFYKIALSLGALRSRAAILSDSKLHDPDLANFRDLLTAIQRDCENHGLTHTAKLAVRTIERFPPQTYGDLFHELNHLNDSLSGELEDESIFRIPPGRKDYFEQEDLFGSEVSAAFSSCVRDIRKAGSCYALEQEDGCVYHLMHIRLSELAAYHWSGRN